MKKYWKIISIVLILISIFLIVYNWSSIQSFFERSANYFFSQNENPKGEMLKIVLSIAGALAVIYGLYVSHRRVRAMEKGVEKQAESIQNQTDQLELSRKSQIDERFKNAVEHLGSEKEPIILGGIAELHQIAKENKENYAEIVFNILTSYIRSKAYKEIKADDVNTTVIQIIVNYLFKKESNKDLYDIFEADISYCNFLSVNLNHCNLKGANLSFCLIKDISYSDLRNSDLGKAQISLTKIIETNLSESNLYKTFFHFSKIKSVNFSDSNIKGTVFIRCEIESCKFDNVELFGVDFSSSLIKSSSFKNGSLLSSRFLCSFLSHIDLSNLELVSSCDFRAASFHEVSLNFLMMESNFKGVDYDINTAPKLYEQRLRKRVWKETEIDIPNLKQSTSIIGQLSDEDCKDIDDHIKQIESEKYIYTKSDN